MPSEQLQFWLESVASLAGIIGIYAIASELLRARRADAREFLFHMAEKLDEMHEDRRIVEQLKFSNYDEFLSLYQEHDVAMLKVYNFWDLLTKTVKDKVIDSKVAVDHFGRMFMYSFYNKYSKAHHELRDIEDNSEWFSNFDWFAKEYARLKPGDWAGYEKADKYRAKAHPDSVWVTKE